MPLTRRLFTAGGLCAAAGSAGAQIPSQIPAWSLAAQLRIAQGPASAAALQELQWLLAEGQRRLEAGDTDAAEQAFDRAALQVHAADIELAIVRTHMQAGRYRQALIFGAHAAGAHRDMPAAAALYAWLVYLGGQGRAAVHVLDEALAGKPDDATLLQMRDRLAPSGGSGAAQSAGPAAWPPPSLRLAPYAGAYVGTHASKDASKDASAAQQLPVSARVVGSATLAAGRDGTAVAYAPAALVVGPGPRAVWLRNGLGQTVPATVLQVDAALGVVVLRPSVAWPAPVGLVPSPRPPFAGSPLAMVDYDPAPDAAPAWPLLRLGFAGRFVAPPNDRLLGISAPPGPRGGPVFDAAGQWCGMALPGADGRDRLLAVDSLMALWGPPPGRADSPREPMQPPERAALDAVYERSLRVALQVLVAA